MSTTKTEKIQKKMLSGEITLPEALIMHSENNDTSHVESLLNMGVNINFSNSKGMTALCHATYNKNMETMRLLISRGAKLQSKHISTCPLVLAAATCNLEAFQMVYAAYPDKQTIGQETLDNSLKAVMESCNPYKQDTDIVTPLTEFILDCGAQVNIPSENILLSAVKYHRVKTVRLLLTRGANIDTQECNINPLPLHAAIKRKNHAMVELLLEFGANPNQGKNITPLNLAIKERNISMFRQLLAGGADITLGPTVTTISHKSYNMETPLHTAVRCGNLIMVNEILDNSGHLIDMETKAGVYNRTALQEAITKGNPMIVRRLIEAGASIGGMISIAALEGNQDIVYALLEAGADIDEQNKYGFTALEYCVTQNKLDMVKALLSKGANVHRVNQNGNTVLHIIAESKSNRDEMLKCVVAKGADLESTNSHGQTALHLAVLADNLQTVKNLLELGSNLEHTDNEGKTIFDKLQKIYRPEIEDECYRWKDMSNES
jgi:ankyrin repeat protein